MNEDASKPEQVLQSSSLLSLPLELFQQVVRYVASFDDTDIELWDSDYLRWGRYMSCPKNTSKTDTQQARALALALRLICKEYDKFIVEHLPTGLRDALFRPYRNLAFDFNPNTIRQITAISNNEVIRAIAKKLTVVVPCRDYNSMTPYAIDRIPELQSLAGFIRSAWGEDFLPPRARSISSVVPEDSCNCDCVGSQHVYDTFSEFVTSSYGSRALVQTLCRFQNISTVAFEGFPELCSSCGTGETDAEERSHPLLPPPSPSQINLVSDLLVRSFAGRINKLRFAGSRNNSNIPPSMARALRPTLVLVSTICLKVNVVNNRLVRPGYPKQNKFDDESGMLREWADLLASCDVLENLHISLQNNLFYEPDIPDKTFIVEESFLDRLDLPKLESLRLDTHLWICVSLDVMRNLLLRHRDTMKSFLFDSNNEYVVDPHTDEYPAEWKDWLEQLYVLMSDIRYAWPELSLQMIVDYGDLDDV